MNKIAKKSPKKAEKIMEEKQIEPSTDTDTDTDSDDGRPYKEIKQKIDGTKKYWLCFGISDDGHREDANTYYSHLVLASSKEEAIELYAKYQIGWFEGDTEKLDISKWDAILPEIISLK